MSESAFHSGDLIGHYRLIEKVGKGGQGEVWRAKDERFDRDVALKILPEKALTDEAARERFRREAQAVGKLNHPNIATAHDFDTKPVDYLVTEFVSGSGLDQKLASGALPEEDVVTLGLQLAAGLEAAHHQGIIHRDLKPGNLRISETGTLKILDFGLAEMFDPAKDIASVETITINMTLTGTVPYMAPEQFTGIADQRTDLWSAGAVLYEMATGRLPFTEAQVHELRDAIQLKEPPKPREVNSRVSSGLEQVILRCLRKKPDQRYQSATELREDLERLQQGRKTKLAEKTQGRRFAVVALAAVLAVSGLAVIQFWPQIRQKLWPEIVTPADQFRLMAILPVNSPGANPSEDALVRGMADTVTANLARSTQGQKLQLIPPGELISRGATTSEAVNREFGVERVLEVSVQHSGDTVRITCSLIDPKSHRVINACSVTGDKGDLFALQDNLVAQVIAMLPADTRAPQPEPGEVHAAVPEAYEFYLKGRGYLLDYQKPENIDAAIKEFEQALKVSPNYAPALAGLGQAYWTGYQRQHKSNAWLDMALHSCQAALKSSPGLASAHACLGEIYTSTGKYEEALEQLKQANQLNPDDVPTLNDLAEALDRSGKTADAEATYKRAIDLQPQYWGVYEWAGVFYFTHANYASAEEMFRKASHLAPSNHRVLINLGDAYLFQGRYQEAIDTLQKSLQLRPTMQAYSDLGAAYFYMRRYAEAISAFEKARSIDDQDYLNWGNLGDALYWAPNRRSEANTAYKRAIELAKARIAVNPKDEMAHAYVAEYSAMIGDKHTATSEMQKTLELAPDSPEVMFRAALVWNQLGDQQKTLSWLRKAASAKFSRTIIRNTPDFSHLQTNPEFAALVSGT